jgi:hypothetical protein
MKTVIKPSSTPHPAEVNEHLMALEERRNR